MEEYQINLKRISLHYHGLTTYFDKKEMLGYSKMVEEFLRKSSSLSIHITLCLWLESLYYYSLFKDHFCKKKNMQIGDGLVLELYKNKESESIKTWQNFYLFATID